jgi:DNA-binding transcriptional LysR family regulator
MSEIDLSGLDLNLLVTLEVLMREGNVTRAAERLGRTQSAVSHALGRLREQLGDPLLVKAGGRMSPSPFALKLVEEIRPILRNIQRVIAPPEPFRPKESERVFRIASPEIAPAVMAGIIGRVHAEAPRVMVDWTAASTDAVAQVAAGLIDIAELGGSTPLPEGLEVFQGKPWTWLTYARKDHPALDDWGIEAWTKWPHLKLRIGNTVPSPVEEAAKGGGPKRRIGAYIPTGLGVGPLVALTNMLATFPPIGIREALKDFGLRVLEPPFPIAPMPVRFLWSSRLANDPGSKWFRAIVMAVFSEEQLKAEEAVAKVGIVKAKRTRRH